MARRNEDASIELECACCGDIFSIEGRFNAEGQFEPFDSNDRDCRDLDCGCEAYPYGDDEGVEIG